MLNLNKQSLFLRKHAKDIGIVPLLLLNIIKYKLAKRSNFVAALFCTIREMAKDSSILRSPNNVGLYIYSKYQFTVIKKN